MKAIGVDPSLTATGIADVDGRLTVVGGAADLGDGRLCRLYMAVIEICAGGRPDLAVIEDLPKHAMAAGVTGMAQGVVRLALQHAGVPYATVPAATLKKFATGSGGADKPDMRMALYQRTGLDERNADKVDAAWLRAAGLQHLGAPAVQLPAAQVKALDKVNWPSLEVSVP